MFSAVEIGDIHGGIRNHKPRVVNCRISKELNSPVNTLVGFIDWQVWVDWMINPINKIPNPNPMNTNGRIRCVLIYTMLRYRVPHAGSGESR